MDRSDYLPAAKLCELAKQVDKNLELDEQAQKVLQDVADDFVENLTSYACRLAQHRNSKTLEVKDVQMALEKNWDIRLPGIGDSANEIKQLQKRPQIHSEAYKQRVAAVRKSQAR